MALMSKDTLRKRLAAGKTKPESVTGLEYEGKAIVAEGQIGKPTKAAHHNKLYWPEAKKIEACTMHAALGNLKRVSELTKIPYATVQRWSEEDWWLLTQQRIVREENHEADRKITNIVDKAYEKILERVEHGDTVYDIKRGVVVPVPVSARDLSIVAGTLFDKRQLLRGEATKITRAESSEEQLQKLAQKFMDFVKSKEKVIEGEYHASETGESTEEGSNKQGPVGQPT